MRKLIVVLGAVILASVFASCGSTPRETGGSAKEMAKKDNLPDWCYEGSYKDKDGYYASGSSTVANQSLAMQTARLNARGELAKMLGTVVKTVSKQSLSAAKAEEASSEIDGIANALLVGSRQTDYFRGPNPEGEIVTYVQVFMPKDEALDGFKSSRTGNDELRAFLRTLTEEQLTAASPKKKSEE